MHQALGQGAHVGHRFQTVNQLEQRIALRSWHVGNAPTLAKFGLAGGGTQGVVGVTNGGVDFFLPDPAIVEFDANLLWPQSIHVGVGIEADVHFAGQGVQGRVGQVLWGK